MTINRIYDYFERNPQLHVLFLFDKGTTVRDGR